MDIPVPQILPDANQEGLHIGGRPAQDISEEHQADALETRENILRGPGACL